jgi:hypothetical protein
MTARSSEFNGTFQTMAAADLFEGSSVMRKQSGWKRGWDRERGEENETVSQDLRQWFLTLSWLGCSVFEAHPLRVLKYENMKLISLEEKLAATSLSVLSSIKKSHVGAASWKSSDRTTLRTAWHVWSRTTDPRKTRRKMGGHAARVYQRSFCVLVLAPSGLFIRLLIHLPPFIRCSVSL